MRPVGEWSAGVAYADQILDVPYLGTDRGGFTDSPRTVEQAIILSGEVGVSERFSLTGAVPLRRADLSGADAFTTTGAGDLQIGVRQALTNPEKISGFSAVAIYGAWVPTGGQNDTETLGENVAFSRGAVTLNLGGETAWKAGAFRISGRIDGQFPLGADRSGYRFAPTRNIAATLSHPLAGEKLSWLLGASVAYIGGDKMNGVPIATRGGVITRATGGILWSVARRQNVGLLFSRLIGADMNGDGTTREGQLVARNEFVVGWQGTFGTHRHPVDRDH